MIILLGGGGMRASRPRTDDGGPGGRDRGPTLRYELPQRFTWGRSTQDRRRRTGLYLILVRGQQIAYGLHLMTYSLSVLANTSAGKKKDEEKFRVGLLSLV